MLDLKRVEWVSPGSFSNPSFVVLRLLGSHLLVLCTCTRILIIGVINVHRLALILSTDFALDGEERAGVEGAADVACDVLEGHELREEDGVEERIEGCACACARPGFCIVGDRIGESVVHGRVGVHVRVSVRIRWCVWS